MNTPLIGSANKTPDPDKIRTLGKLLLAAFLLVGISLFYWSVVRAPDILARDDNPRLVEAALRVQRGRLLDARGTILAENQGPADEQTRAYPVDGGHGVGYFSLRYGTAGAEAAFGDVLSGANSAFWPALWQSLRHLPPQGADVTLTLDQAAQETAVAGLVADGAALLLEIPREGQGSALVRALASSPGFDPNQLNERFEALAVDERAPLLNRVTQGEYQPGLLLAPFILAAAVDQDQLRLTDEVADANRPVQINGTTLQCLSPPPEPATWADVLRLRCPGPLQDLADQVGPAGLESAFAAFGLDRDPLFELDTQTNPDAPLADPLLAGIGQDNLTITPLQIALAAGALAADGVLPAPQIGLFQQRGGATAVLSPPGTAEAAVSSRAAIRVRDALPQAAGLTEFSPVVLSGPDGSMNAWYLGLLPGANSDLVAVVVLEDSTDGAAARDAGRALLQSASGSP